MLVVQARDSQATGSRRRTRPERLPRGNAWQGESKVKRRGFIAALAAFASSAVLDPERALWVRGAKTISIPREIGTPYDELVHVIFTGRQRPEQMAAWLEMRYGNTHEIQSWGAQSVFSIMDRNGGLASECVAYVIPNGWRNRYPAGYPCSGFDAPLGRSPSRIIGELTMAAERNS